VANAGIVPVAVYVGNREAAKPGEIVAGGHGNCVLTDAGMLPEPAPPVIVALSGVTGVPTPHCPTLTRGSVGIQPFSRPSR